MGSGRMGGERFARSLRGSWGWRGGLVVVVLGALALDRALAGSASEPRGMAQVGEAPIFGMQAVPKFDERLGKGSWSGSRDRGMAMHRDLGVRLSREGLIWRHYQPEAGPHVPHQADFDDVVSRLDQAGMALQFMVTETPYWASSAAGKRKDDPRSYRQAPPVGLYRPIFTDGTDVPGPGKRINPDHPWAAFLATTARRYQGRVRYWQCWNEPDYPKGVLAAAPGDPDRSWQGSVRDYVRLLVVMHTVVKWIDPEALIVTGGLGHASYLQAMLDHGAGPYFDLLDFHAYGWPGSDTALSAFLKVHQGMRHVLDRNGQTDMGMLCSETGYSASEPLEQADAIVKFYATTLALGIEGTVYYSNTNPSWRQMGLVDWRSLTQRTAGYWAYKNVAAALGGMRFVSKLPLPPQVVGYLYAEPGSKREVAILWAPYRKAHEAFSLRWTRPGAWTAVAPQGARRPVVSGDFLGLHATPVILDSDARDRYALAQPNPPLARNGLALRSFRASHSQDDDFLGAERALDGDTDSQWSAGGSRPATASFAVELLERAKVRELRLKTGPLQGAMLDLQVSEDGRAWRTVRSGVRIDGWQMERLILPQPTPARWVRVLWRNTPDRGAPRFSLFELELYD